MNRKLFFALYNLTKNSTFLTKTSTVLSKGAELIFFIIYGIGGIMLLFSARYMLLAKYIIIPFVTLMYNTFLRKQLKRPRPFVREENVVSLTGHKESNSCPSNHAASAMVIAFSWYCIYPSIVPVLVVLAIFTGLSRVMTGVHYPFDVLLGWIIGAFAGLTGFSIIFR